MAKIKVNKGNLETSVSSYDKNVKDLNNYLSSLKSTLNKIPSHEDFANVVTKASNIASSVDGLKSDYETETNNLKNYVSSIVDIDEKAPSEETISISTGTMKVSAMTDVDFSGLYMSEYKNPAGLSGGHLNFINSIIKGAVESYKKYGVLPSLTLAQAILESGWGESGLSANYNNLFGIKAGSGWTGKRANMRTSEQNSDGSYVSIYSDFRAYDSPEESIEDHAKLLTNDRYKPVLAAKNYKEACVAVRQCGYATSLNYSNNLISLIEQYGLNQWDPK